jgi:hypothetical protein
MSEQKYAAGQIDYFVGNANGQGLIRIEQHGTGKHIASMPRGASSEADADRIINCWNACVGMENPQAEIERLRAQLAAQQSAEPTEFRYELIGENQVLRVTYRDESNEEPFGSPGVSYSEEYEVVITPIYTHAQPVAAIDELAEFKKVMADVIGPKYVGAISRLLSQKENGEFVDDDINSYWFVWQARAKLTTQQELKK